MNLVPLAGFLLGTVLTTATALALILRHDYDRRPRRHRR